MFRNSTANILNQSISKNRYNILSACTHERQESLLSKTEHDFYAYRKTGVFKPGWNESFAPLPHNYHLLNEQYGDNQIPIWLDFDIVLSANKFGQFQILSQIANNNNIPLISVEHTSFMPWWSKQQAEQLSNMRGTMNVFITHSQLEDWKWQDLGDTKVIHHGIESNLFKPNLDIVRKNYILEVANDFINRDSVLNFSQFKRVVIDNNLPFRAVGDTKGFSQAPKDINELIKEYQNARIFVNSHHISPVPMSLLESASCGCGIVSCNTPGIAEFFTHGKDALLYNNEEEMYKYLIDLLNDSDMSEELGKNARKMIQEKCDPDRFIREWDSVFDYVANL